MSSKTKNVLVVGAGPAGVSAAYFLRKLDKEERFSVDLVERLSNGKYQRYHDMCGEGVSSQLFVDIKPLKPKGLEERIHLVREYWPGDVSIESKMDGYIINRSCFLESIIDEFVSEGGSYQIGNVNLISQRRDYIKVKINNGFKKYDYVVAADGPNSLIRNSLGLAARSKLFFQYVVKKEPDSGVLKFYYDEKYHGDYLWEFPHEDNVKIGFPADASVKPVIKDDILLKQSKYICYGGIERYVSGNILLVGDAAGQTNVLTKGGIRNAMNAGRLAAESIIQDNPLLYEYRWRGSPFSNQIFSQAFSILKGMSNNDLEKHVEPLRGGYNMLSYFKSLLFYREYRALYKAYMLSNKFGW